MLIDFLLFPYHFIILFIFKMNEYNEQNVLPELWNCCFNKIIFRRKLF